MANDRKKQKKGSRLTLANYRQIKLLKREGASYGQIHKITGRGTGTISVILRSKSYEDYMAIRTAYTENSKANRGVSVKEPVTVKTAKEGVEDMAAKVSLPKLAQGGIVTFTKQPLDLPIPSYHEHSIFGGCTWSKWSEVKTGTLHTGIGTRSHDYQERHCTICNKIERRSI